MKIIVIEDEDVSRNGLVRIIEKMNPNYKVIGEAVNGLDGIDLIKELKPDVVITDIKMPKLDGLMMVENLKDEKYQPLYVILSGFADFKFAQKAIRLGVTDYLIKPVTYEDIENILIRLNNEIILNSSIDNDDILEGIIDSTNRIYSLIIEKTVRKIQKDYNEKLVLEEIAEDYKVTREYLSSLFHKEVGTTFSKFLKIYRISIAKKMLLNEDIKIYEVAQKVGYDDPRYFCRIFKEITGVSASAFVKSNI